MPGFLSEYNDVVRLTFGANEQWWVEVRQHLRRKDFRAAQDILVRPVMRTIGQTTETRGVVDTVGYQNELVFRALVAWNLTDEAGVALPLAPDEARRASIEALPEEVFDRIVGTVQLPTARPPAEKNGASSAADVSAEEAEPVDPFRDGDPAGADAEYAPADGLR